MTNPRYRFTTAPYAVAAVLAVGMSACSPDEEGDFDWIDWDAAGDGWTTPRPGGGGGGTDAGNASETGGGTIARECPPRDDDRVRYFAEDRANCRDIDIRCGGNEVEFNSDCGCGCVEREFWCPDAFDPSVVYVGGDPSGCTDSFSCLPGWDPFSDGCGCGCQQRNAEACPLGQLGDIDPAVVGNSWACQQALVCFSEQLDEAAIAFVQDSLVGVICDSATIAECPVGTVVSCGGALGAISETGITGVCDLARSPQVEIFACQNP